jgi:hypothetical protein
VSKGQPLKIGRDLPNIIRPSKKLTKNIPNSERGGEGPRPLPLFIFWDSSHFHTDLKKLFGGL